MEGQGGHCSEGPVFRSCQYCRKPFIPRNSQQRYCSTRHSARAAERAYEKREREARKVIRLEFARKVAAIEADHYRLVCQLAEHECHSQDPTIRQLAETIMREHPKQGGQ